MRYRFFNFHTLIIAFAAILSLSSCEEELDMDMGNVSQIELNKEKYEGIPEEFYSGKEKDWENALWGNGLSLTGERYTCFQLTFPKCKALYATVPMYKKVAVTANGIDCQIKDMLADKYDENINIISVTFIDLMGSSTCSEKDLQQEWSKAYGEYKKLDNSAFTYTFPLNPSFMERTIILKVGYSKQYPSFENPDSLYTPTFNLLFEQLGNRNHLTSIE